LAPSANIKRASASIIMDQISEALKEQPVNIPKSFLK
jgi:hypothetical protein